MSYFNIIAATTENTVVTEYKPAEIEVHKKQYEFTVINYCHLRRFN